MKIPSTTYKLKYNATKNAPAKCYDLTVGTAHKSDGQGITFSPTVDKKQTSCSSNFDAEAPGSMLFSSWQLSVSTSHLSPAVPRKRGLSPEPRPSVSLSCAL